MFDPYTLKIAAQDIIYILKTAFPLVWGWGKEEKIRKKTNALETKGKEMQNNHYCAGMVTVGLTSRREKL